LRSQQGYWDRATLDRFLASPQEFAPGVNMTFGGVRSAADRKVVLDFLESLTPDGALVDSGAGEAPEDPDGSP
jgi:cytochrome c